MHDQVDQENGVEGESCDEEELVIGITHLFIEIDAILQEDWYEGDKDDEAVSHFEVEVVQHVVHS